MPFGNMTEEAPESEHTEEALKLIDQLILADRGYDIFRGQQQFGWDLLPKALREEGDHLEALTKFRRECYGFGHRATEGLDDMAVAQHYGLATNLLDWTTNPLVALFFACEEALDKDGKSLNGEIFVLNNPKQLEEEYLVGNKWTDIEGLRLYNPPLVDPRITRQKGLFTIQAKDTRPVKDLVSSNDLVSHLVLAELKRRLLEILYRMGIDRSTLFPTLDGLCDKLNWETKNRAKRNFPPVTGTRVIYLQGGVMARSISTGELTVETSPEDIPPEDTPPFARPPQDRPPDGGP
jgi:FRG domain